jgi:hypothetical protein
MLLRKRDGDIRTVFHRFVIFVEEGRSEIMRWSDVKLCVQNRELVPGFILDALLPFNPDFQTDSHIFKD